MGVMTPRSEEATALPDFNIGGVRVLLDYYPAKELSKILRKEAIEKSDQGWGKLADSIDRAVEQIEAEGMEDFDV